MVCDCPRYDPILIDLVKGSTKFLFILVEYPMISISANKKFSN